MEIISPESMLILIMCSTQFYLLNSVFLIILSHKSLDQVFKGEIPRTPRNYNLCKYVFTYVMILKKNKCLNN